MSTKRKRYAQGGELTSTSTDHPDVEWRQRWIVGVEPPDYTTRLCPHCGDQIPVDPWTDGPMRHILTNGTRCAGSSW